jgi:thiol reductant ABC exporter CydC subunit
MSGGALVRVARAGRPGGARPAVALLLGALATGAAVGLLATSGYLISRAALEPPILTLTVAIVGVRLFAVTRSAARYGERVVSHDVSLRALAELRARVFERLVPLVPGRGPGRRGADLLSRAVADVDAMQHVYVRVIAPPVVALLAIAGSAIVAGLMLPAAGLALALVLGGAAVALPLLAWAAARRAGRRQAPARAALGAEVLEALQMAPEIAAYGMEDDRLARVGAADRALARTARRDAAVGGMSAGLVAALAGAAAACALVVAIPAAAEGRVDGVLIGALALLAMAAAEAVAPLPAAAQHLGSAGAAAARIEEITEAPVDVRDPVHPAPFPAGPVTIALEGARVRYADDRPLALDGLDLRLEPGRLVALVGPSGSGKSTALHALVRFLDPDEGRVTVAGRDVREYAQDDLRRAVRLAAQDAHLFATTIRENVRIGRRDAGDEAVLAALAAAGLAGWVASLPEGLDTAVGEGGARVSGGQRQRIAIARALVSRAPVLLLDEPTAHLDPDAARALVRGLAAAAHGAAILLVTHSALGLERADEIVVLEAGRVVDRGTHEALASRCPAYARMLERA